MNRKDSKYELIVIAGSAGAIEATGTILSSLPSELQASVLIVLHRMRNVRGNLDNIYRLQHRNFRIKEVDDKEPLQPGVIYVAPPNYHLLIEDSRSFALDYSELVNFSRPSIDVSFESAAAVYGEKMIAVLLTGASHDGSDGIAAAQSMGAYTIVQDPNDSEYFIMPGSALKKMKPDLVLPLRDIGPRLAELLSGNQ